jgi:hypothetical protein
VEVKDDRQPEGGGKEKNKQLKTHNGSLPSGQGNTSAEVATMFQSDDVRHGDFCRRCVRRQAIERSIRALMIRTHRFGRHRATSPENVQWAAKMVDGLTVLLEPAPSGFTDGEDEQ